MKRMIAFLLSLVLVLACLAGCAGTRTEPVETVDNAASSSDTNTSSEATGEKEENEITGKITYVSWMTKGEDEAVINGFMEEYPGVEVEIRAIDGTNYGSDVLTLCAGGDVPDVLLTKPVYLADLVDQGYIAPLDGIAGVETQTSEEVNQVCSRNGNLCKQFLDQRDARAPKAQPKILSINAWNEWTEGSYLEPDVVNGYAYLEAIRRVFG